MLKTKSTPCTACDGTGEHLTGQMESGTGLPMGAICTDCNGEGLIYPDMCPWCHDVEVEANGMLCAKCEDASMMYACADEQGHELRGC